MDLFVSDTRRLGTSVDGVNTDNASSGGGSPRDLLPATPCSTGSAHGLDLTGLGESHKYSREVHMRVILPEASWVC